MAELPNTKKGFIPIHLGSAFSHNYKSNMVAIYFNQGLATIHSPYDSKTRML